MINCGNKSSLLHHLLFWQRAQVMWSTNQEDMTFTPAQGIVRTCQKQVDMSSMHNYAYWHYNFNIKTTGGKTFGFDIHIFSMAFCKPQLNTVVSSSKTYTKSLPLSFSAKFIHTLQASNIWYNSQINRWQEITTRKCQLKHFSFKTM